MFVLFFIWVGPLASQDLFLLWSLTPNLQPCIDWQHNETTEETGRGMTRIYFETCWLDEEVTYLKKGYDPIKSKQGFVLLFIATI